MKFRNRVKLKTILIISFTVVSTFPILFFGISQSQRWEEEQVAITQKKSAFRAQSLARMTKEIFAERIRVLDSLANDLSSHSPLVSAETQKITSTYRKHFNLNSLIILNTKGFSILADPQVRPDGSSSVGVNFQDRKYFQKISQTHKTEISDVIVGKITGKPTIQIIVPISNQKNEIVAYLSSGVNLSEIQEFAKSTVADESDYRALILDDQDHIITQAGGTALPELSTWKPARNWMPNDDSQTKTFVVRDPSEESSLTVMTRAEIEGFRFYVALSKPYQSIASKASFATKEMFFYLTFALAGSLIFSFVLAGRLAHPIARLVHNVDEMGRGAHQTALPRFAPSILNSVEIVKLSRSFERMRRHLQRHMANLENLVSQRTHQLVESNRELETQRANSRHSEKMAALGEMASGVAHEINNPLAILMGHTYRIRKMIQSDQIKAENLMQTASAIDSTVLRISKIIQSLRFFSRDGSSDPFSTVSVKELLEDTMTLCRQRFFNNAVNLVLKLPSEDLNFEGRAVQISQVLLNLINNGFDAAIESEEKWVQVEVLSQNEHILFKISDSGLGISDSIRHRIMEPFFTTKPVGKGTGLGLSISQGIINAHHGSLVLDPNSEQTCFMVTLPKTQPHQNLLAS